MLDTKKCQELVDDFVRRHNLGASVEIRLLDLISEVGELAKAYLTTTNYGRQCYSADADWELEIGDVFFSLICLANNTSIDLSQALLKALDKYERRIASKGTADSGKHSNAK